MKYRSPMSLVRGLGAARDGTHHWWAQRLTALALIPLGLGAMAALIALLASDYHAARALLAHPVVATLAILFVVALFHHTQLGVQVVIEDYVHSHALKIASIVLVKFAALALGAACVVSILLIAFSAGS